jgi:hypothetical protein
MAVHAKAEQAGKRRARKKAMQIIWDILLQTVEILTLVFGILGLAFSLMLTFSPAIVQNIGKMMNRSINVDKGLAFLDKEVPTGHLILNHPTVAGICLIAGSVFALAFFFFKLDVSNFSMILLGTRTTSATGEMLFNSLAWIGKIACMLGLIYGIGLLVAPARVRAIEKRIDAWVETRTALEKLDSDDHNIDSFLYRHPIGFGVCGAAISFLLIVLSILNILD